MAALREFTTPEAVCASSFRPLQCVQITNRRSTMTHSHREFNDDHTPLAYLITFRCYGTWLHGDSRGSVDRFHNRYGAPLIAPNRRWLQHNKRALKRPPVNLSPRRQRSHPGSMQNSTMAIVDFQHSDKPRTHGSDCELRSGNSSQHVQGQRHSQDEGGKMLAKPWHSVGQERKQETSLDGAGHIRRNCLC